MDTPPQGDQMPKGRTHWNSRIGFILAAAGSAVGLGNIWKFPYITGENGGGLFVLIYLVCIALVGLPILVAEIMIGRAAQAQPIEAFKRLQGGPTAWAAVGWLGVIAGFLILSFYIVVAGWAMDYTLKSVVGFTNPIAERAEQSSLIYRSTAPLSEMRETLTTDAAQESLNDLERSWRRQFAPTTWEAWERLDQATAVGANQNLLMEDPSLSEAHRVVSH